MPMTRTVYIYTLACPKTGDIKYIGQTVSISKRLGQHMLRPANFKIKSWIWSLQRDGLSPVLEILDSVPKQDADRIETYWIHQFLCWGFSLYNIAGRENYVPQIRPSVPITSPFQEKILAFRKAWRVHKPHQLYQFAYGMMTEEEIKHFKEVWALRKIDPNIAYNLEKILRTRDRNTKKYRKTA